MSSNSQLPPSSQSTTRFDIDEDWRSYAPYGARFLPSPEDLIVYYLRPAKAHMVSTKRSLIFRPGTVMWAHVHQFTPLKLVDVGILQHGEQGDMMYFATELDFISKRKKTINRNIIEPYGEDVGVWREKGSQRPLTLSDHTVAWTQDFIFDAPPPPDNIYFERADRVLMTEYRDQKNDKVAIWVLYLSQRTKVPYPDVPSASPMITSSTGRLHATQSNVQAQEVPDWRSKVPPGVKFLPSAVELIRQYLIPAKDEMYEMPAYTVSRIKVYDHSPVELQDLGTSHGNKVYFITRDRRLSTEAGDWRVVPDVGTWKMVGKKKPMIIGNEVVGWKQELVFQWNGNPTPGVRFTMTEYLHGEQDDIVLCSLRLPLA